MMFVSLNKYLHIILILFDNWFSESQQQMQKKMLLVINQYCLNCNLILSHSLLLTPQDGIIANV